jgi:thiol-disulfide isomerase/thioredoxin
VLLIPRRAVLGAGGTLAAALLARKPRAEGLDDLASVLKLTDPPVAAPDVAFVSADGTEHHLADFLGHGMVINLWATWCAPCVAEMPSLAKLSKTLAPDDIAVLPLSSDRGGGRRVAAFYQEHDITGLPVLLDPQSAAAHAWQVRGLPTSLIIDKEGREVARLEGSADWSTPAAARLVRKLVSG